MRTYIYRVTLVLPCGRVATLDYHRLKQAEAMIQGQAHKGIRVRSVAFLRLVDRAWRTERVVRGVEAL